MSSSSGPTAATSSDHSFCFGRGKDKGSCSKGNWSPLNIGAMVFGFVLFWPVGLLVLYWNISGRDARDLPAAIKQKWSSMFNRRSSESNPSTYENSVFDEFQQTQYDRIAEIKEEITERSRRFSEFRFDATRRAEEEEFKKFMASNPDAEK